MTNRIFLSVGLACLFIAPGAAFANGEDTDAARGYPLYGLYGTSTPQPVYSDDRDQSARLYPVEDQTRKKPAQGRAVPPQGAFPPYLIGVFR